MPVAIAIAPDCRVSDCRLSTVVCARAPFPHRPGFQRPLSLSHPHIATLCPSDAPADRHGRRRAAVLVLVPRPYSVRARTPPRRGIGTLLACHRRDPPASAAPRDSTPLRARYPPRRDVKPPPPGAQRAHAHRTRTPHSPSPSLSHARRPHCAVEHARPSQHRRRDHDAPHTPPEPSLCPLPAADAFAARASSCPGLLPQRSLSRYEPHPIPCPAHGSLASASPHRPPPSTPVPRLVSSLLLCQTLQALALLSRRSRLSVPVRPCPSPRHPGSRPRRVAFARTSPPLPRPGFGPLAQSGLIPGELDVTKVQPESRVPDKQPYLHTKCRGA